MAYQSFHRVALLILLFSISSLIKVVHLQSQQNRRVSYEECRRNSQVPDCICNSTSIVESLNIPYSTYQRNPEGYLDHIQNVACPHYVPLPPRIVIQMLETQKFPPPQFYYFKRRRKYRQRRKRSISRQKRQVPLGSVSDELLQSVTVKFPPSGSQPHYYKAYGSRVELGCYGEGQNGMEEQALYGGKRIFKWTHGNGQPVIAPMHHVNRMTGNLIFPSVRLVDTGIYTCTVMSEEGDSDTEEYKSQLDVIAAPMMWLQFQITYRTDECRPQELYSIKFQIKDVIHNHVCDFCPVRNISVNCVTLKRSREGQNFVKLSFTMSTLGFENKLDLWELLSSSCLVDCQEALHNNLFRILDDSILKFFTLELNVQSPNGETSVYDPQPNSKKTKLAEGCPSGFFANDKICFPCAAGKYSPNGESECFPCEVGSFQPNPGSSECFHCHSGYTTLEVGSRSQMDCVTEVVGSAFKFAKIHWIIAGCCAGILLLIILILLIYCCWPNSCPGKCIRCYWCFGKKQEEDGSTDEKGGEHEKLINDGMDDGEGEYGKHEEGEMSEDYDYDGRRKGRRHKRRHRERSRPPDQFDAPRFPHDFYDSYDDDRRKNKLKDGKGRNDDDNLGRGVAAMSTHFERRARGDEYRIPKYRKDTQTVSRSPNRNGSRKLPICNYRIVDMDHHQLSEQAPGVPFYARGNAYAPKPASKFKTKPKVLPNLGTVLSKSKSFAQKLKEQRRKLGERISSRSASKSKKGRSPTRSDTSKSTSPTSNKKSRKREDDRNVKISESKNIYHDHHHHHHKSKSKISSGKEKRSKGTSSSNMSEPVSSRIKSFERSSRKK